MDELVEFLTARLDEMQRDAESVQAEAVRYFPASDGFEVSWAWARMTEHTSGGGGVSYRAGAPTPEFVLADIAADRKLVAQYEEAKFHYEAEHDIDGTAKYSDGGVWEFLADLEVWEKVLKIRAERFSGHRDYRQEWTP